MYRIVLNFRGSKFSRIAIFEDFVANLLHVHAAHRMPKIFVEIFLRTIIIREIKDSRKFSPIAYFISFLHNVCRVCMFLLHSCTILALD